MAETMEQFMSKTRADYGSGVARPKIEDKDNFELKGQFFKELRTNTFSDSDHEDANEHIEKVLEIVDLFHIPNITIDQVMLRAFPMSLIRAASRCLRNKPSGSITTWEDLKTKFLSKYCPPAHTAKKMEEINNFQQEPDENLYQAWEVVLFYNGLNVPARQILDSRGAIPLKTSADAKVAIQEMDEYSKKWHNGTSRAKRKLAHTKLTVELADGTVKYPKGIAKNMLVGIGEFIFPVDFIILDMPEDIKVPLILGRPFLSITRAKIDVFKRKITLRVREEKIIFKSVKPASSLIKRVYMLSLRERMELDLKARLMGETLVLNRSLDPFFEDYIELNDLNVPLKLRRDQVDDLMPTIEEGKVVEEFRARNDVRMVRIFFGYPSECDRNKKIRIDCAHNLMFSCMIGFEFVHANFFPILYINVMSKKFYNSIRKDKLEYKENNVVGSLMNIPIFVGTFSILIDFAVLEDMDAYRDEGMGAVIFGEPLLREVGIYAKWFEGMITIYNGNEKVTYQMVWSHPRFKHHNNEQCNKIPPLLKVSEEDKMNGISHSYQKLKNFYKGVLNLGPEYVRDAKIEEWLTRGHISVHEME
ncbi:homeodomain-like protein [Tanacetum coccineum]